MADADEYEVRTPARRFQKIDFLVVAFNLASDVFESISDAFTSLTMLTAAHANYTFEQERFRLEAARQIETITTKEHE